MDLILNNAGIVPPFGIFILFYMRSAMFPHLTLRPTMEIKPTVFTEIMHFCPYGYCIVLIIFLRKDRWGLCVSESVATYCAGMFCKSTTVSCWFNNSIQKYVLSRRGNWTNSSVSTSGTCTNHSPVSPASGFYSNCSTVPGMTKGICEFIFFSIVSAY